MFQEFKKFVGQGNAIDLAVGVIVGAAFGKIVSSLVNDMVMPLISLLLGKVNFADRFIALDGGTYASLDAARKMQPPPPILAYGAFINTIIEFLIIAFAIFLVVRQINKWKAAAAPKTP